MRKQARRAKYRHCLSHNVFPLHAVCVHSWMLPIIFTAALVADCCCWTLSWSVSHKNQATRLSLRFRWSLRMGNFPVDAWQLYAHWSSLFHRLNLCDYSRRGCFKMAGLRVTQALLIEDLRHGICQTRNSNSYKDLTTYGLAVPIVWRPIKSAIFSWWILVLSWRLTNSGKKFFMRMIYIGYYNTLTIVLQGYRIW